jgi:hypothetical protein
MARVSVSRGVLFLPEAQGRTKSSKLTPSRSLANVTLLYVPTLTFNLALVIPRRTEANAGHAGLPDPEAGPHGRAPP